MFIFTCISLVLFFVGFTWAKLRVELLYADLINIAEALRINACRDRVIEDPIVRHVIENLPIGRKAISRISIRYLQAIATNSAQFQVGGPQATDPMAQRLLDDALNEANNAIVHHAYRRTFGGLAISIANAAQQLTARMSSFLAALTRGILDGYSRPIIKSGATVFLSLAVNCEQPPTSNGQSVMTVAAATPHSVPV